MPAYIVNILVGFDTLCNSILGGSPYETISLRSALARDKGKPLGCLLCKVLGWFQANHCDLAKKHAYDFWRTTINTYK